MEIDVSLPCVSDFGTKLFWHVLMLRKNSEWLRQGRRCRVDNSNPETSLQVLFLSYDQSVCQKSGENEAYLVISNQVFVDILRRWLYWKGRMQQSENASGWTFPLNLDWFAWAPRWTCMWSFKDVQEVLNM